MRILFWNIMKQVATFDIIVAIAQEEDADIIAIAEMPQAVIANMQNLCDKLNAMNPVLYKYLPCILVQTDEEPKSINSEPDVLQY